MTKNLIGFAIALASTSAMGDPPDDASVRRQRMEAELDTEASAARARRTTNIVTGVSAGALLMPTGIILETRTDIIGIGMTTAGATQLALVPLSLFPSGIERVAARYHALRDSGAPDDLLLRVTEDDWRTTAESTRTVQRVVGWTLLALGAGSAATSLVLLLDNPGNSRSQYNAGAIFAGAGVPLLTSAFRLVLQPSAEETSWRLHEGVEARPARLARLDLQDVSATAVPGGLLFRATVSF